MREDVGGGLGDVFGGFVSSLVRGVTNNGFREKEGQNRKNVDRDWVLGCLGPYL